MDIESLKELLVQGEGLNIEFKESRYKLNKIQTDNVIFENANIPHFYGELNPTNFTSYSKNPSIAKIFREIGFADELGSGVKNLYKYSKLYGGSDPIITEDEIFNVKIQTTPIATKGKLLVLIKENPKITRENLASKLDISINTVKEYISKLKKANKLVIIEMAIGR